MQLQLVLFMQSWNFEGSTSLVTLYICVDMQVLSRMNAIAWRGQHEQAGENRQ